MAGEKRALLSGAQITWGTQTLIIVQEDKAARNAKVATRGAGKKTIKLIYMLQLEQGPQETHR